MEKDLRCHVITCFAHLCLCHAASSCYLIARRIPARLGLVWPHKRTRTISFKYHIVAKASTLVPVPEHPLLFHEPLLVLSHTPPPRLVSKFYDSCASSFPPKVSDIAGPTVRLTIVMLQFASVHSISIHMFLFSLVFDNVCSDSQAEVPLGYSDSIKQRSAKNTG